MSKISGCSFHAGARSLSIPRLSCQCSWYVLTPRPLSLPSPTATLPPTLTASLGAPLAARAGHAGVTGDMAHRQRRRRRRRPTSHRPLRAASRCPLGALAAALYVSPPPSTSHRPAGGEMSRVRCIAHIVNLVEQVCVCFVFGWACLTYWKAFRSGHGHHGDRARGYKLSDFDKT